MPNLTTIEMVDAAQIFQDSVKHVLSNLVPESRMDIQTYIGGIILLEKTYLLPTHEGIPRAIDLVFTKDNYRDFIFNLHITFFSRFGNTENEVSGLISNIARGIGLRNINPLNLIPNDINNRLINENTAIELLMANKWLVVLIMLQLFISVDSIIK